MPLVTYEGPHGPSTTELATEVHIVDGESFWIDNSFYLGDTDGEHYDIDYDYVPETENMPNELNPANLAEELEMVAAPDEDGAEAETWAAEPEVSAASVMSGQWGAADRGFHGELVVPRGLLGESAVASGTIGTPAENPITVPDLIERYNAIYAGAMATNDYPTAMNVVLQLSYLRNQINQPQW